MHTSFPLLELDENKNGKLSKQFLLTSFCFLKKTELPHSGLLMYKRSLAEGYTPAILVA